MEDIGGHGLSGVTSGLIIPYVAVMDRNLAHLGLRQGYRSMLLPQSVLMTSGDFVIFSVLYELLGTLIDTFIVRLPIGFTAHL
eukprot:gene40728-50389_t